MEPSLREDLMIMFMTGFFVRRMSGREVSEDEREDVGEFGEIIVSGAIVGESPPELVELGGKGSSKVML